MIPQGLTKEHFLKAAAQIKREGMPADRHSVHYDLILNGTPYPPKYLISLATKFATGDEYPAGGFNAVEAKKYFLQNGYEVKDRRIQSDKPSTEKIGSSQTFSISEIAAVINQKSSNYLIGKLQQIRTQLKGRRRVLPQIIFSPKTTFKDWAFHFGGRTELQFNIGSEISANFSQNPSVFISVD